MTKRTNTKQSTRSRTNGKEGVDQSEKQTSELHELFLDELADMHNAEEQIVKALPKMAKAAQSDELREAFESHLEETKEQLSRLQQAAESLGESIKRKPCKGMKGIIEEGEEMMEELKDSPALDAALIAGAQKVEHYEIASYGSLCAWGEQLGHEKAVSLLKQNQDEEEVADEKLTEIAESLANQKAQTSN